MDTLAALVVVAVLTRGGPQPDPPPADHADPVEITVYDDDRARGAERCRVELAVAPPGSTCHVEPETDGGPLEPGWVWDSAPPWARHMDPRSEP